MLLFVLIIFVGGANKAFACMVECSTEGSSASYANLIDVVDKSHHSNFLSHFASGQVESLNNVPASKWSWNRSACLHLDRWKLVVGRVPLEGAFHRKATSIPVDYDVTIYDLREGVSDIHDVKLPRELTTFVIGSSHVDVKISNSQFWAMGSDILIGSDLSLPLHKRILLAHNPTLTLVNSKLTAAYKQKRYRNQNSGDRTTGLNDGWPIWPVLIVSIAIFWASPPVFLFVNPWAGLAMIVIGVAGFLNAANASITGNWWP